MPSPRRAMRATQTLPPPPTSDTQPPALLLGPCAEVWADDPNGPLPRRHAAARWQVARRQWYADRGDTTPRQPQRGWSIECLQWYGQAESIGRPLAQIVAERFAEAGCTTDDIPQLREEARALYARPEKEDR